MRLFISYRRADTQPTARAMKEFLDATRRVKGVFFDHDTIPRGKNFVDAINHAIRRSTAAFVLIGDGWLMPGTDGTRRIDNPGDFVRIEVAALLKKRGKVIPVLVDGAIMPAEDQLPDDLKALSRLNAVSVRTSHFKDDMVAALNAAAGTAGKGLSYWRRPPLTLLGGGLRIVFGAFGAAVVMFVALIALDATSDSCMDARCIYAVHVKGLSQARVDGMVNPAENEGGVVFAIQAAWIALGAAVPFLWRALRR